jgi:PKD domain
VNTSARPQRATSRLTLAARRGFVLALGLLASLIATLAIAGPADALVTEVAGTKVGLQPRSEADPYNDPGETEGDTTTFDNESGNAVLHGSNEYAIYWDPDRQFHHEWITHIDGFFNQLGDAAIDSPFASIAQYRDRSDAITPFRATFEGSYSDFTKFPAAGCTDPHPLIIPKGVNEEVTCLTDAQLREQLESFIATQKLPTGMGTAYYLLTPPGVTVCLDASATSCSDYKLSKTEEEHHERESASYKNSFCSYHADINSDNAREGDGSTILYAAIPWTAGTLGRLVGYDAGGRAYENAEDCQDGGWNPEKSEETREEERTLTTQEITQLGEDSEKVRDQTLLALELEGPHIEEPNQEGKAESRDYTAGLTDVLVDQISEEEMNMVTDPLLDGWQNAAGDEATDMCRNFFDSTGGQGESTGGVTGSLIAEPLSEAGTLSNVSLGAGRFYINNVFSLSEDGCVGAVGLVPRFTPPDPVNANETVGFDGMESTVGLNEGKAFGPSGAPTETYATFSWNFGDGTPEVKGYAPGAPPCETPWLSPCAASIFHTYQYGGKYNVTLTVTDVAGNVDSISHEVTVVGPPAPGSASGSSSNGSSSSSGSSDSTGSSGSSAAAPKPGVPAPVALASIVRQSLHNALHKGLVVSYSVNEQVAGHFEVLLSSALAHKLHISGSAATGLPAGSSPELVIAKAILVTTKGGRSAVHIQFPKRTASRLAHEHKLPLTLRLVVRNAAPGAPATSTTITSVTLGG